MLDYKNCPHRLNVYTTSSGQERATCDAVFQAIGHSHGLPRAMCELCAAAGTAFTLAENPFLRQMRMRLLKLAFESRVRVPSFVPDGDPQVVATAVAEGLQRRKDSIRILLAEDNYTRPQIQEMLLTAAAKGTITEGEVGELDDWTTEQIASHGPST